MVFFYEPRRVTETVTSPLDVSPEECCGLHSIDFCEDISRNPDAPDELNSNEIETEIDLLLRVDASTCARSVAEPA